MRLVSDDRTLPPSHRSPAQISGHRLIKRRGSGGVAEVWEADSPGGYRVALKLVQLSSALRSGELRALKITREIRHPSLVMIFGTWQVESLLIISMELADRSLWDRFLEAKVQGLRGIPRPELLGYLGSVADGIDYLNDYKHSIAGREGVGVQHRDLKPQNILLLGNRAKVADFGLARVMEQAVASHTGPCTLPYAAPEYFGGETSRQSDQYALAVSYCQLRCGRTPFSGSTAQIMFGHLCKDPDLEGLPAPERPIVMRALSKRPGERWPDCRSFIDALKALESGQGGSIPDILPRDHRDLDSGWGDEGVPPLPSGSSPDLTDFDFITGDSFDLESTGSRGGRAGPGAAPPAGGSCLDRPSGSAPVPPEAARNVRADEEETGRHALPTADPRPKRASIALAVAVSALWLFFSARGDWSLVTRPRLGVPSGDMTAARPAQARPATGTPGVEPGTGTRIRSMSGTRVTFDEPRGTVAETPVETVESEEAAPPTTAAAGSPPETGIAGASTPNTPIAPAAMAEDTMPEPPDLFAPGPKGARVMAATPKEGQASASPVVAVEPGGAAPEAPAVTGPDSRENARGTFTPSGAGPAVASLPSPELIAPAPTPSPPASGRVPIQDESIVALPSGEAGDPGRPTPAGPVASRADTPSLTLPAAVSVRAGESTKLAVRVLRGDPSKPAHLDFHGLPRGMTVVDPTIPAGADTADLVLSASAETPAGTAEVAVAGVLAAGSERGEARIRIDVLPSPATVAYERGRADLARDAYAPAVAAFTEAIRLDPGSFGALFHRGVAYYLRGRHREALADCTSAIRVQPDNADGYLVRARVHHDLGEDRLALADYTEAIKLRPVARTYLARGCLQHDMGAYDRALADFEIALRLRPDDPAAHYRRGLTHYLMGENRGAIRDFTEVIRLDPRHLGAYRYRGDAFARLGEYALAGADRDAFERLSRPSGKGVLK